MSPDLAGRAARERIHVSAPMGVRLLLPVGLLLMLWPVPQLLARAGRSTRRPGTARLTVGLWVAYALAAATLLLATLALSVDSMLIAGVVLVWMVLRLTYTLAVLGRRRREHLRAVLLVSGWDPVRQVYVIEDQRAIAYCLPAFPRPMVVLTRGCLELTEESELAAILAHERHHAHARHHLLVSMFVAGQRIFPFLPQPRAALAAVSAATEALADDVAARQVSPDSTVRAIWRLASDGVAGAAGTGSQVWEPDPATLRRIRRLLEQIPGGHPLMLPPDAGRPC